MYVHVCGVFTQSKMEKSLRFERHFMDIFNSFNDSWKKPHCSDNTNYLKRKPKCKTKNKYSMDSNLQTFDGSGCLTKSAETLPCLTDGCTAFSDADRPELSGLQTAEFTDTRMERSESWPFFDMLCSFLHCSDKVTAHQAAALSRWLSYRQSVQTAYSSLVEILLTSKCPLVSIIYCRIMKQLRLVHSVSSCTISLDADSSVATFDVMTYVLFLQKEMVKFMQTGHCSMDLLNVICLLDWFVGMCHDMYARCSKLCVSIRLCCHWSSSELRWAVLSVMSLVNAINGKVSFTSGVISATDANSDVYARLRVARVPQIMNMLLSTSVQCEIARTPNIYRILNEYWHTTDSCQRQLIVESVLLPKHRMELCIMVLARHCDVLLKEDFTLSLSLHNIFSIFEENVLISVIAQQMSTEDNSSVTSRCQELCVVLCTAVCSYMLYQNGELTAFCIGLDSNCCCQKMLTEFCEM